MNNQHQCIKLENISSIRYGRSVNKAFIHKQPSTMLLVQSRNFSIDGIDWDNCDYIDFPSIKEPFFLEPRDVLFFIKSEGNNAIVIDSSVNDIGVKAVAGPLMFVLRCDRSKILPEYLAWWLNEAPSQAYFKSKDVDGERKSIVRETLEATPICIPTFKEQEAILEKHHSIIKQIKELQATADSLAGDVERNSMPMRHRFIYA